MNIGDKVVVYGVDAEGVWNDGTRAVIDHFQGPKEAVVRFENGSETMVHIKQCRRLVKKPKDAE